MTTTQTSSSENMISTAFALGFMITREGFNAECDYEHLAPNKLETRYDRETIAEFISSIEENEAYRTLKKEALEYIANLQTKNAVGKA